MSLKEFYHGKKILITGHTGFKGAWMCCVLQVFGADVTGYALEVPTEPALFSLAGLKNRIKSVEGDIRDLRHLENEFRKVQPEIVIHMAAQPLVRESYERPVYTYETNVMGTVHILECMRQIPCVKSFVNVTTDKVYKNKEWVWGYREDEDLNGYDPYSNSKSCSELVTDSYRNSFFQDGGIPISTVRAGNVIGGGDFAVDRIIPDCIRAATEKTDIFVRNPYSRRPYQHVLEPISAYLLLAKEQFEDTTKAGCYNVGPEENDCYTTGMLTELFCKKWNDCFHTDIKWKSGSVQGPHEANYLKLDCSKIKEQLKWYPKWDIETAMDKVIQWNQSYMAGENVAECMKSQIYEYFDLW